MSKVLIVGSVAYDGLKTPYGSASRTLGGSATYSSLASALFAPTHLVGVVGRDFRNSDLALLKSKGIDLDGLEKVKGKTFFWKGYYKKEDLNVAYTLRTDLNVFAGFNPKIPAEDRTIPFLFLANIHPELQMNVLKQMKKPRFTVLDTRELWINNTRKALLGVMRRVDLMVLNDMEVKLLTGEPHLRQAAHAIRKMGPRRVIVKKPGELGSVSIAHKTAKGLAPDQPAIAVLDSILSGGNDSRLYRALVDKGLALSAQAQAGTFRDLNLHLLDAQLAPGSTHEQVEKALLEQIELIKAQGVTPEEVERAHQKYRAERAYRLDGTVPVVSELNEWIATGDWTQFVQFPEAVQKVTPADVQRVARTYLNEDQSTTGWFVPVQASSGSDSK